MTNTVLAGTVAFHKCLKLYYGYSTALIERIFTLLPDDDNGIKIVDYQGYKLKANLEG